MAVQADSGPQGGRRLYGADTVPLPVLTDPRTRLVEGLLGLTASGLFAIAIPLGIALLGDRLAMSFDALLKAPGVSLIVSLWIFTGIGLWATSVYSAILVLRRASEAGAAWIAFGVVAASICASFAIFAGLTGAWVSLAASGLILGAGLFDSIQSVLKKAKAEKGVA